MLNESDLQAIKCITLIGENVVITAAHFDALLSTVRELQRQVQEREADYTKLFAIYRASNEVMARLGMDGEIATDHASVDALMNALYDYDGGAPKEQTP